MSQVPNLGLEELRARLLRGQAEGPANATPANDVFVTREGDITTGAGNSDGQVLSKVERKVFA
jgi:hypothetical protein